ncbi:MAG: hypothetical protein WAZ21_03535 [Candidatus Saccharimonadales bacterium]
MSLLLIQQTVTELHQRNPYEKKSVIIITLQSGRKLYVNDFDERTKSIFVQLRSFTNNELGLLKRHIRQELFDRNTSPEVITNFLEDGDTRIMLEDALSLYVSPISRIATPRLCIDHNRVIEPRFLIGKAQSGSSLPAIILNGLRGQILTVALEQEK